MSKKSQNLQFLPQTQDQKLKTQGFTKNSRIYLKTQAKKLNFRHLQNQRISTKCTKKA